VDLKNYFRKIREIELSIGEPHTFVTSLETPDGGKAGQVTEVPREIAARMIVEGFAAVTTKAEKEKFLERQAVARLTAQKAEMAQRLQVTIVADGDNIRPAAPGNGTAAKK